MDILKVATEWARAEIFSSSLFVVFGVFFVMASVGFWHLGKTELARAYITPTLVVGGLLLIIGIGLVAGNVMRLNGFEKNYKADAPAFVQSEAKRAQATIREYETVVFKGVPVIIIICALIVLFIDTPRWRAISITTLAMMSIILLIDGTASGRMKAYNAKLQGLSHDSP